MGSQGLQLLSSLFQLVHSQAQSCYGSPQGSGMDKHTQGCIQFWQYVPGQPGGWQGIQRNFVESLVSPSLACAVYKSGTVLPLFLGMIEAGLLFFVISTFPLSTIQCG